MKRLILAAAALAVPLFTAGAQAATIAFTTPQSGTSLITGFDFDPNNAVARSVPAGNGTYTQLFQARVNGFQGTSTPTNLDTNGTDDGSTAGKTFELTIVLGYTGTATQLAPGFTQLGFAGGPSYFQLFYQDLNNTPTPGVAIDSNSLTGQGFNNGRLILSGTVSSAVGSLQITDPTPVALDQNGTNDYPGVVTASATGSLKLGARVDINGWDPAFFNVPPLNILIGTADSVSSLPFKVVDPSQKVVDSATGASVGTVAAGSAAYTPNTGAENGISGPDIRVQTDANASFDLLPVPAPQSAAAGFGLLGLVGAAGLMRRRRLA